MYAALKQISKRARGGVTCTARARRRRYVQIPPIPITITITPKNPTHLRFPHGLEQHVLHGHGDVGARKALGGGGQRRVVVERQVGGGVAQVHLMVIRGGGRR